MPWIVRGESNKFHFLLFYIRADIIFPSTIKAPFSLFTLLVNKINLTYVGWWVWRREIFTYINQSINQSHRKSSTSQSSTSRGWCFLSVLILLKKPKFKLTVTLNFGAFATYCSSSPLHALWQRAEAVSLSFDSQVMYAGCCPSLPQRSISPFQFDTCDRHCQPLIHATSKLVIRYRIWSVRKVLHKISVKSPEH